MAAKERVIHAPDISPDTEIFWAAATDGHLLIRSCRACGEAHHYPRQLCPFCLSADMFWAQMSGDATLYSYSIMRTAPIPYVIAYVQLVEGPTVMTNIIDCDFSKLAIGQPMRLAFKPSDGGQLVPMFTPAE